MGHYKVGPAYRRLVFVSDALPHRRPLTDPPARPCPRHRHVLLCPIADDLRHGVQGRLGPQRGGRAAGQGHARARGYPVRSRQRSAMPVRRRDNFSAATIYAASRYPRREKSAPRSASLARTHPRTHSRFRKHTLFFGASMSI